ncbi:membrane integrity-associated transporter subunit PqiC [uncultured Legionella sp.]|uniref:PqiC family protein n=1 Tax=uncultured Legionella sp. TaxID=210934 RepID=UPI00261A14CA|nr:PqiC family protein [uncultured Legionella sp.]
MKSVHLMIILSLSVLLCACGRSKQPEFYVLNPLPAKATTMNRHAYLKIGLEAIRTPPFTEKPQLMIHDSANRVQLEEFHQWASSLDKNIKSVLKANLNNLLPGVVMEEAPWDIEFNPDFNLQIEITEFKIDVYGNSSLRACYALSNQGQIIKKYDRNYHLKVPIVTVESLVTSMNTNLNAFSQDLAHSLINQKGSRIKSSN